MNKASTEDVPDLLRVINAAYEVEKFFVEGDRTNEETIRRMMQTGVFLSVDPSRQGLGLGRRLVDVAEDYARANGCTAMDIRVVNLRTELPPFYRKLGYVDTGQIEPASDPRALQPFYFVMMSKAL